MTTITEDYVSFEIAKLLKEKRMDISCFNHYVQKNNNDGTSEAVTVCTLQMAMKWLREMHNIDIIAPPQYDNSKWTYSAIIFKLSIPCTEIRLNDNKDKKEEVCEAAIKYCLENLI